MFFRALLILAVVAGTSLALTWYFGADILLALGLLLTQAKIVLKKIASVELPAILAWLKVEARAFLRVELLKKWIYSSLVPLLIGNRLSRWISGWTDLYRARMTQSYDRLLGWYGGLEWYEKSVAALILLFATLGLTVSSLGLWLILFSVKLPLWILAAISSLGQSVWLSLRKMAFKSVAFFQLTWTWRLLRRLMPEAYLDRKRRLDYRVARAVVRRRRLTLRQLQEQKDRMPLRWAVMRAGLKARDAEVPDRTRN